MSKKKNREFIPNAYQVDILRELHAGWHLEKHEDGVLKLSDNTTSRSLTRFLDINELIIKSMIRMSRIISKETDDSATEVTFYKITPKGIVTLSQIDIREGKLTKI